MTVLIWQCALYRRCLVSCMVDRDMIIPPIPMILSLHHPQPALILMMAMTLLMMMISSGKEL